MVAKYFSFRLVVPLTTLPFEHKIMERGGIITVIKKAKDGKMKMFANVCLHTSLKKQRKVYKMNLSLCSVT